MEAGWSLIRYVVIDPALSRRLVQKTYMVTSDSMTSSYEEHLTSLLSVNMCFLAGQ